MPILERKGYAFDFPEKEKKGQKKGKLFENLGKNRQNFEKASCVSMHETGRICPGLFSFRNNFAPPPH